MTTGPSAAVSAGPTSLVVRSIHAMAKGDQADFDPLYHPRAVDRENRIQPPSSRVQGAACFYSTALWLPSRACITTFTTPSPTTTWSWPTAR